LTTPYNVPEGAVEAAVKEAVQVAILVIVAPFLSTIEIVNVYAPVRVVSFLNLREIGATSVILEKPCNLNSLAVVYKSIGALYTGVL